ncbi:cobaltochelatase subunit CobN, partial [Parasutterella excrementihominis]
MNGGTVLPAPGGDPVLNPNVLPTGRNMYSVNAETTPNPRA